MSARYGRAHEEALRVELAEWEARKRAARIAELEAELGIITADESAAVALDPGDPGPIEMGRVW